MIAARTAKSAKSGKASKSKPKPAPASARARLAKVYGAVNIGSFRISAMILGETETGELVVLGSGHRASQGIKRGYVTDMKAATHAIRDAVERAEQNAQVPIQSVFVSCAGAGLTSDVMWNEIEIGGRRVEEEDIEQLLLYAREAIQPMGREVLHATPAHYTLDGAHGVADPRGLHAERLGVHVHVTLADGAPIRNLKEAVNNAHLQVEDVVAAPLASSYACLSVEERDLGVALVEIGSEVTNVSVFAGGMLLGLRAVPIGSGEITDAIASAFCIRRFQAERLKCVAGSAIASPSDHREMIPVHGPGDAWHDEDGKPGGGAPLARGADDKNRIARAELVSVVTGRLSHLTKAIADALKELGFSGPSAGQVVLTGGGAELAGLAEYTQSALGMPVRLGRMPKLKGLPEAHSTPGFATLAGLCLYAAEEPVDIQTLQSRYIDVREAPGARSLWRAFARLFRASREYF